MTTQPPQSQPPARWRPRHVLNLPGLTTARLALIVAACAVVIALAGAPVNPVARVEATYKATAILPSLSEVDLEIPRSNLTAALSEPLKPARPKRITAPLAAGESSPAAPVLGWFNKHLSTGSVMRWCLVGDEQVQDASRKALNDLTLYLWPKWQWVETCENAHYRSGESTAARECARPDAVGCAAYHSETSGNVTFNPDYVGTRPTAFRQALLNIIMGHEGGHIADADHVSCGTVRNPVTGRPERSAMTGVRLDVATSCSEPPASGVVAEDFYHVRIKYGIAEPGRGNPPPQPQPTPIPVASGACAQPNYAGWCVLDVPVPFSPAIVQRWAHPDLPGTFWLQIVEGGAWVGPHVRCYDTGPCWREE